MPLAVRVATVCFGAGSKAIAAHRENGVSSSRSVALLQLGDEVERGSCRYDPARVESGHRACLPQENALIGAKMPASIPPSTGNSAPVIIRAESEARKRTASAISDGSAS